jgi:hypothetical protein
MVQEAPMQVVMTREEYEALPFRQDVETPIKNVQYRSRGDSTGLYVYVGDVGNMKPEWASYNVTVKPNPP